jgi:hypothetical protein
MTKVCTTASRAVLAIGILGVGLAQVQGGAAAGLSTAAGRFGGGNAAVPTCDSDGFTFRSTIDSSGRITDIAVASINGACAGGTLRITLAIGGLSTGQGSAALPATGFGGSAIVTVTPTPQSDQVTAIFAVVEGP